MMSSKPSGAGLPCEPWRVLMYCNEGLRLGDLAAGFVILADAFGRGRIFLQHPLRPCRAPDEVAAAIGAVAAQPRSRAIRAERALEGADQRIGRAVGQVLVAALAVGAEIQHGLF